MGGYVLRRLGISAIVLIGISMVVFLLLHMIYPNPGRDVLGVEAAAANVAAYNRQNGYTGSVAVQYWRYVSGLLHGNLGYSPKLTSSVATVFAQRWARSLYLSAASLVLAILITVPLGIFQAVRRNGLADHLATGVELVIYATPEFLFYLVALQLFAFTVPVFGSEASQSSSLLTVMGDWHLAHWLLCGDCRLRSLPVHAIGGGGRAGTGLHEGCPGEGPAGAVGLVASPAAQRVPADDHAGGLSVPALLAGNFIVETVFNYNGLGLTFFTGLQDADYPVLLAYTLIGATLTVLGNFAADIALMVADPRLLLVAPRR
jgi:peptide/nickel transport system permease protein